MSVAFLHHWKKEFYSLFNRFLLLLFQQFLWHINFIQIAWIPLFASNKHVINSDEYHPCDGDNCSFFTPPSIKAFVLDFVVRSLILIHDCMGNLYQCRFEVITDTCNSDRFLLTGRFVVARG